MGFASTGRLLGVANSLLLPSIAVWQGVVNIGNPTQYLGICLYLFAVGLIVALIEVPSLCSCSIYCVATAKHLKRVSGWTVRGGVYLLGGCGGVAVYIKGTNDLQDLCVAVVMVVARNVGRWWSPCLPPNPPHPPTPP